MEVVLRLLSELRFVLIAVCGICCAAFIFTGLGSLRELRRAVFRLERSAIVGRAISAWLKAGLCVVIGAAIWMLTGAPPQPTVSAAANPLSATPTPTTSLVEPTAIPTADLSSAQAVVATSAAPVEVTPAAAITASTEAAPTTAAGEAASPTSAVAGEAASPTPAAIAAVATEAPAAAPTAPPPTATATPAPELPATATATEQLIFDCPNPEVQITSPGLGETVSGAYNVRGTARFPNGSGKFRVDILRPNIEGWAFLWENHNEITDGVLMPSFNSGLFPPGTYVLRISIVDGAGQETGISCRVSIRIAG